jgi:hypothetical protein
LRAKMGERASRRLAAALLDFSHLQPCHTHPQVPTLEVERELRKADGVSGLFASAAKRFAAAMSSFGSDVYPHLLEASRWQDDGWENDDSLLYANEAVASFGADATVFGLPDSLNYTWTPEGAMLGGSGGVGRSSLEQFHNRSEEIRANLASVVAAIDQDGEDAVRLMCEARSLRSCFSPLARSLFPSSFTDSRVRKAVP